MSLARDIGSLFLHTLWILVYGLTFNKHILYFKRFVRMWCGCYIV